MLHNTRTYPLLSHDQQSLIPQIIYDLKDIEGTLGPHPTMFYHPHDDGTGNYDVGISNHGQLHSLLTPEFGKKAGAGDRVERSKSLQYGLAYYHHMQIIQIPKKCAFNAAQDALWNFLEL